MKRVLLILAVLLPLLSCSQGFFWTHTPTKPRAVTIIDYSTGTTSTYFYGGLSSNGGIPTSAIGFCYSSTQSVPTLQNSSVVSGELNEEAGINIFTSFISGLTSNTLYYWRAYATNVLGTGYGNVETFTTLNIATNAPTVTTTAISNIQLTTASSGGNVTSDGGAVVTARGVCWNTTGVPFVTDSKTTDGSGTGSFTSSLTGLSQGETYYVRAYATNSTGTGYGEEVTFTTNSQTPTVTTTTVSNINTTYALFGWNITSDGGSELFSAGVMLNKTGTPTLEDYTNIVSVLNPPTGAQTSYITELTPNTLYYYRAFAENINGVSYGSTLSFTTGSGITSPVVTTTEASDYYPTGTPPNTLYYIGVGGNVTSDGNTSIIEKGIVYSTTNTNPSIGASGTTKLLISAGGGEGAYSGSIHTNSVIPGATYYIRAYAINSAGTSYGSVDVFTACIIPTNYNASSIAAVLGLTINGVYTESWDNLTEAQQMCNDWNNPAGRTIVRKITYIKTTSPSGLPVLGNIPYMGWTVNDIRCNKLADGYYLKLDATLANPDYIFTVSGGTITNVTTCN